MTTPRDLLITTMEVAGDRPPEQGDLSLALAGAELVDLLNAGAAGLDGEHIVPGARRATGDRLLDEALSSLPREAPYESVDDWLWRRGRDLASVYLTALTSEGQVTRERRPRWVPFGTSRTVVADTPARRSALERWTSDEPVLAALGAAAGIRDEQPEVAAGVTDDAVTTVLAGLDDARRHLAAERQRRSVEDAAFDNVWRGE